MFQVSQYYTSIRKEIKLKNCIYIPYRSKHDIQTLRPICIKLGKYIGDLNTAVFWSAISFQYLTLAMFLFRFQLYIINFINWYSWCLSVLYGSMYVIISVVFFNEFTIHFPDPFRSFGCTLLSAFCNDIHVLGTTDYDVVCPGKA